jgi:hypothetical protein
MKWRASILIVALALVAAACGGDDGSGGVATADDLDTTAQTEPGEVATQGGDAVGTDEDSGEVDTEAALLDFAQCLRDEGIQADDPQVDADGNVSLRSVFQSAEVDRSEMQEVLQVCGEFLEGIQQRFGDVDQTERQDSQLAFAQCMRDNGIDMDDPDFSNSPPDGGGNPGEGGGPFGQLDREDPDFQSALDACQDLRAGFGRGAPGGEG